MKLAEARRIIWGRLATTAREDGRNVQWDEEFADADPEVFEKASEQVADSIERRLRKGAKP